uniref:Uncharacterized protein n=1 Tax=Amphimedon queenslandica TaxID=400682 RepID=A0A1X7SKW0_AMPQE
MRPQAIGKKLKKKKKKKVKNSGGVEKNWIKF